MIRSLGSSLLAKAGSGSLSRRSIESRITKPEIPGKGAVGTAGRELTEQTDITPTAPGSEKVIRSAPGIESASLPGIAANQVPLVAGIGSPGGAPAPSAIRSASQPSAPQNQPMFQGKGLTTGGGSAASNPGQAGRQASAIATMAAPKGQVAGARTERASQAAADMGILPGGSVSQSIGAKAPQTTYQVEPLKQFAGNAALMGILPAITTTGGRVSAENPGGVQKINPTAGQALSNVASRVIDTLGKATKNILPEKGISEKLMSFAKNPQATLQGQGSIAKTVNNATQAASSALRSVVQQVQNTFNNLRSKFKLW